MIGSNFPDRIGNSIVVVVAMVAVVSARVRIIEAGITLQHATLVFIPKCLPDCILLYHMIISTL